jgi:hypothetical protein
MKERLIEFLAYLSIGQTKFEENVGLSRGFVHRLNDNITLKTLKKIMESYPELNEEWLKTGEGEMLKPKIQPDVLQNSNNINSITVSKKAWDLIEKQAQIILSQQKTIEALSLRDFPSTAVSA